MARIFLSHSSADNFAAKALADWLGEQGWSDVFLDILPDRGIAAGQRWERSLHQAADRCEAVVFLVTRAWLASGWCRKEYELARSLAKQLFAVIAERGLTLADLPPELKDTWQVTDLAGGADHRVFRATIPGSEEEKHVSFSQAGLDRLKAGLKKAGLDPREFPWPPEGAKAPAPYAGLRPLDGDEAGLLFGRDADLVRALDRLRALAEAAAPRIAVILGASGAGKSSFLRAGLLPRLARDDARFLTLPPIRPGLDGETGLVAALEAATPGRARADIRADVAEGRLSGLIAAMVAAAAAKTLTGKPPVAVIAVDQAEELFAADSDGRLLGLLADLARTDAPAALLLFAIRSDAYDALERAKPLEGMAQIALPLPPMPRNAARAVIEGPAARYAQSVGKLDLDPRLTQALLDDLDRGGGRDALPLLAFTLEHLWREYGRSAKLTLAGYEAFGGLAGAIEAGVRRAYARADADPRIPHDESARDALLRRGLVPWLAGIDPDTKAPRRNVARAADIPEESRPLIDLMVEERLLSRGADEARVTTIEPAHEALLRQWGKLKGWLEEDFAFLAALEAVQRASRDWDANARAEAWLAHRGQRLAEAAALDARPDLAGKLGAQDREYLAACRASEEAARAEAARVAAAEAAAQARALADARAIAAAERRVARRTGAGLAAAVVLAVAAGGAAWFAKRQADFAAEQQQAAVEQKAVAEREAANAKVQEARANIQTEFAKKQEAIAQQQANFANGQQAIAQKEAANAKVQQAEAERQKAEAAKNFEAAKSAIDRVTVDIAQGLKNVQGLRVDSVREILGTTRDTINRLISDASNDPRLLRSKAVMLDNFAGVYMAAGDVKAALSAATEGVEIARSLSKLKPDDVAAQRDVTIALGRLGDVKQQAGDMSGALASEQECLDINQKLVDAYPTDEDARNGLSICLEKVGRLKLLAGDTAGALTEIQLSLDMDRKSASAHPEDAEMQRNITVDLNKLGDAKLQGGDEVAALAAFNESLDISRKLAEDRPNDTQALRDLSVSLDRVGKAQLLTGDQHNALATIQSSLDIRRKLAAGDPGNAAAKLDVSSALDRLGDVKMQAGDREGALSAYQESLDIRRNLQAADPNAREVQRDLQIALTRVGEVKLQSGETADALEAFQEGLDIVRELAEADPDNAELQGDVAVSLAWLSDAKMQKGDLGGALDERRESLAIRRKLARLDPGNLDVQLEFAIDLGKLGELRSKAGDRDGALAAYQEGIDVLNAVIASAPGDVEAATDLVITLKKVADLGDHTNERLSDALLILKRLESQGLLPPDKKDWRAEIESDLKAVAAPK